jgi:hypothetical protein
MSEKKKLDENQIWTMVMTLLPVAILMNLGNELTDDAGMRVLYAAVLGGIGGLLGFAASFLTKNKSRNIKIFATIALVGVSGASVWFLSSNLTDNDILYEEWITQKIGGIEFDSPTKLALRTWEIPQSVAWIYSEMNLYSDAGDERSTSFLQTRILTDTISIEDVYSISLEGMLQKLNVNLEEVKLDVFGADDEEISAMFSFNLKGKTVYGYGFMYLRGETLESIWLMPLKKGFSREYIEEFEAGIFPDYE